MIERFGPTLVGTPAALLALDVALKATALLALAFGCHWLLGRRRALARSALWNSCLIGLLLIPVADLALPRLLLTLPTGRAVPPVVPPLRPAWDSTDLPSEPSPPPFPLPVIPTPAEAPLARPAPAPPSRPLAVSRWRPGPIDIALGAYLAGASLLLVRLLSACGGVARLKRGSSRLVDGGWSPAMQRRRADLGIGRGVDLLVSGRISVPIVVGWLRPAVIIPERLAEEASPGLIDAILLHELGHVRRGDYGWNLVRKVTQLVYWPHPLVWPVGRIIEAVREQACDDLCVHGLGGSAAYRASLLEVASGLIRRPSPSIGLAMAKGPNLVRRLAWIDRTRGASRCLLRWPARLALAVTVAATAGVLGTVEPGRATAKVANQPQDPAPKKAGNEVEVKPPAPAAAVAPAPAPPEAIEIIVRAKDTGRPLAGAKVEPLIDQEQPLLRTDGDGRLRIDLSRRKNRDSFSIDVWAEGYVQQRYFFAEKDARHPRLPASFSVELHPGEQTLGGKVTDEQGQPVGGVTVKVWGYLGSLKHKSELAYMVDATTDAKGEWRCRCFRGMTFANLYLSHPDYLADDAFHARRHGTPTPQSRPQPGDMPLEALRDFSDVQVLERGVAVMGEVVDEQGKPVPGAEVGWLPATARDTFHHDLPTTLTDERGRFRLPHVRPGRLALQVTARGHAPSLSFVEGRPEGATTTITLGPGRILAGRVVDSRGRPIAEASVHIDTWRGYRSLGGFLTTDAEGRFRWDDAPADVVLLNASRTGFNSVIQQRVTPDDGEALLTLSRSLSISGRITDAETKKSVEQVRIEVGTVDAATGQVSWGSNNRAFAMQGRLQANLDAERAAEFRLRIRAKGYQPFESRAIRSDEGQVDLDVKLVQAVAPTGDTLSGVVLRPDGGPLAGAEVAITYPMRGGQDRLPTVHITNGKIDPDVQVTTARTDAQGRFSLTREPDPEGRSFALVVVHPDFYAEVPRGAFEADPTVKAAPWGRIEGVIRLGARVAAGADVGTFADRLRNPDVPAVSDRCSARADAEGRFVLERVVPGDVRVTPGFGEGDKFRAWSNGILVEVRPGATAVADIGGRGRAVVARVALPDGFDPKADYAAHSEFEIESDRPSIPYPADLLAKRDGSMVGWAKQWWASPEGHAYRRAWFRHGQAKLQADGTLRVDDVPPGEYRLQLTFSADTLYGPAGSTSRIAHATRQFTLPEGGGAEPYDLGVLRPKPKEVLKVGQAAPPFDVATLDGGRLRLEDFRGKYLLLDFWATWCGPCVAELPELTALHDRFGRDERFAMLSLSLDAAPEAPRKFVADRGLAWKQGFLGEWAEAGVADAYHVQSIPATFLIAPDGTIKAIGLRGASIGSRVADLLK